VNKLLHALRAEPRPDETRDHVALSQPVPGVAVVTLWRPEKRNAFNLATWRRIAEIFQGVVDSNQDLRVVVLRGGAVFGAGADIEEFPEQRMTASTAATYNEGVAAALTAVQDLPVPVIAMVRGLAVGGGCELAAACDVRIASTDCRLGIPIGRLGVTLGYTEARALVRLVGASQLKRMLFDGQLLDAQEALRIGLVELVVDDENLEVRTCDMATTIVQSAPVTIRAAKAVADMCARPLTANDTEQLIRFTVEAYPGPDLKEGVEAFLARRRPKFGHNLEESDRVSP
jgi:enoyl-CoA hydratase